MSFRTIFCAAVILMVASIAFADVIQTNIIPGVPDYEWRTGCSPTSGGMLIAYWSQQLRNLWDGVPPSSNNPDDDSDPANGVIDQLATLMRTDSSGGTFVNRIPKAIKKYVKSCGYKFKVKNQRPTFDFLKMEIEAGRPMHAGVTCGSNGDAWGHSVVVYGYKDNPGFDDDWIAVRDTWYDGNSDGTDGITATVEGDIEWWKWSTDKSDDLYITRICYVQPNLKKKFMRELLAEAATLMTLESEALPPLDNLRLETSAPFVEATFENQPAPVVVPETQGAAVLALAFLAMKRLRTRR